MKNACLVFSVVWLALLAGVACGDDTSSGGDSGSDIDSGHDEDAGHDAAVDGAGSESAALCNCLLINCHDPFHAQYGVADDVAIAACVMDADGLPHAEMPVTSGNFIECRAAACEAAVMDDTRCAAALGGPPCQ